MAGGIFQGIRKGGKRDYFQIKSGKIVEGQEPPGELPPFSSATFSAAGREGTAVAPCGKVVDCPTYLYLGFHLLCSMTKLKEHRREIC